MNIEEIKTNLCYYDERNPLHFYDDRDELNTSSVGKCFCDNCFYGRTELANVLIDLINLYQIPQ